MLMVFAVISFPTMDVMAKYLSQTQPPMQVVWARYTGQFILILLIFINRLGEVTTTTQPGLQLARSIALFGGTFFFFTSLSYMQIGKVAAIFQVAPVIITLMAVMFLKETIGIRRIISLIGGFVGALIIIQPEAGFFELGAFLPMLAATCYAGYSVLTRLLKPGETANTTLFYTAGFGAVVSTAILPFIWQTPQSYFEILLMASMSLFGGFGHYCVIQALMRAEATELAPLNY
ncbi:MAG: DMT family transporter, partial [Candidatus Puniceispirillaceae bacterium]